MSVYNNVPDIYYSQTVAEQMLPMSSQQEYEIATKFKQTGNTDYAKQLIMAHLRFVIYIAKSYSGYNLPMEDLVQEGNIGLMVAVKKFDPDNGARLSTYAVHWIRSAIQEYIIRNWHIVRLATTKAQRKLFFHRSQLTNDDMKQADVDNVAERYNVSTQDVREMNMRVNGRAISIAPIELRDIDNDGSYEPPYLADDSLSPETALTATTDHHIEKVRRIVDTMDDRTKDIITSRWLVDEKVPLRELADKYNVSAEAIRQAEMRGFKQIKQLMLDSDQNGH